MKRMTLRSPDDNFLLQCSWFVWAAVLSSPFPTQHTARSLQKARGIILVNIMRVMLASKPCNSLPRSQERVRWWLLSTSHLDRGDKRHQFKVSCLKLTPPPENPRRSSVNCFGLLPNANNSLRGHNLRPGIGTRILELSGRSV